MLKTLMTNVDWTKWSAIAEIVSSAAILLTLVYLALQTQQLALQNQQLVEQTQQNLTAIRSATIQDISRWSYDSAIIAVENADFRATIMAACAGDLTGDQSLQLATYYVAILRLQANRFYQTQLGFIDQDALMALGGIGDAYRQPFFPIIWANLKSQFALDFQDFVDTQLLPRVDETCSWGGAPDPADLN